MKSLSNSVCFYSSSCCGRCYTALDGSAAPVDISATSLILAALLSKVGMFEEHAAAHALQAKASEGRLIVMDTLALSEPKTVSSPGASLPLP